MPQTGLAPQPRQWFADVTDESILSLLAPAGARARRTPAPPRSGVPTSSTPAAPQRRVGRQADVEPDRLCCSTGPRACPDGQAPTCAPRSAMFSATSRSSGCGRPDVVPQAVSMWRAVQTQVWRDDPSAGQDDPAQYHRRWDCASRGDPAGPGRLVAAVVRRPRASHRIEIDFPTWRRIRRAPSPACWSGSAWTRNWRHRRRFDARAMPDRNEWVERYRADAAANGYPA